LVAPYRPDYPKSGGDGQGSNPSGIGCCGSISLYRHTFGSHLAQKGVSLYKISEMMGNSPEICRKHYAALMPQEMHREVEF
jgi:site-specific recombinase XerD